MKNMRKLLLFAAIMLFALTSVVAQGIDTTIVVKNHEIKIYDNDKKIDVKVYEIKDSVRVSKEPIYQSRYSFENDESSHTVTIKMPFGTNSLVYNDGTDSIVVDKSCFKKRRRLEQPFPILYFNYINLTDGAFGAKTGLIPQRPVSFEWGMYFPMTIFSTGKKTIFGMATGLGFSNSYNHFNTNYVMTMQDNNVVMKTLTEHTEGRFAESNKSYLRYWSFRLPLTMQLQWKVGKRALSVSAGAEVEWRFGMRSFAKYDGAKRIVSDKLNYKPFGCNALFQVGYSGIILFTRFGLTDMFGSDAFKANQFTAGIGFNF